MSVPRILVADDQPDVLEALRLLLSDAGYEPDLVASVDAVLERLQQHAYDLALVDLNYARDTTSGREGLELIARVRAHDAALPIVVMTGWGTIETAVEAMRRGARSFVQKPWDDATLLQILAREIEDARTRRLHHARQQRDAEEAQMIQRSLLPATLPEMPGLRGAAEWRPASGFGGDCYDVLTFDGGAIGIAMADVAGKGLPAALLMSNIQAAVRAFAQEGTRPRAVCDSVNRLLCRTMVSGRFVTFCYLRLDPRNGTLAYANAGHNPPLVVRRDGGTDRLHAGGTVLGVFPEATYCEETVPFLRGDRLIVYTDGVTEARNPDGEEYGDERLAAAAARDQGEDAVAIERAMMDDVLAFAHGHLHDDATLMVLLAT